MFYNERVKEGVPMHARPVSCAFTGHRPGKLPWGNNENDPRCLRAKRDLRTVLEELIIDGYEHCICGMAEGCDFYFCEALLELKSHYPHISIEAAIPCPTQADAWGIAQQRRYAKLLACCDEQTVIEQKYTPDCMRRRNRYMVDHASVLVTLHNGLPGGTRYTIEYAMRRGLKILDIPIEEELY